MCSVEASIKRATSGSFRSRRSSAGEPLAVAALAGGAVAVACLASLLLLGQISRLTPPTVLAAE